MPIHVDPSIGSTGVGQRLREGQFFPFQNYIVLVIYLYIYSTTDLLCSIDYSSFKLWALCVKVDCPNVYTCRPVDWFNRRGTAPAGRSVLFISKLYCFSHILIHIYSTTDLLCCIDYSSFKLGALCVKVDCPNAYTCRPVDWFNRRGTAPAGRSVLSISKLYLF